MLIVVISMQEAKVCIDVIHTHLAEQEFYV